MHILRHLRKIAPLLLLAGLLVLGLARAADPGTSEVVLLQIEGPIGPATADYVNRGIDDANAAGTELIVLRMDTPGGLDTSMRDIIKSILASPAPVASFVAPGGSRAASAGTYILYASHIAAMAPATNLGAATPVQIGGMPSDERPKPPEDATQEGEQPPEAAPSDAKERKAINDAVAYIRGLASKRGRNADWAEQAVRDAASLPAEDALAQGVIDLVAADVDDLLDQVDGMTIETASGSVQLETARARLREIEPDWRTELLSTITNPTVAYLLMLIGIYGLIFEGYNPGAIVPGVTGAICLLLALFAFQVLPVNTAGLALILLGIVLMVAEAFAPSFGALGLAGIVSFVIGSIILMDTDVPGYMIPMHIIILTSSFGGLAVGGIIWFAVSSRNRRVVSGREEMLHASAVALRDFEGRGRVRAHGETWAAVSDQAVRQGQALRVTGMDGLTLHVEPVDQQPAPDSGANEEEDG